MQSLILGILLAYVLFLIVLGVLDAKKAKDFDDFAVAGKKQKAFPVTLSILATVLGASTTMGIADTSFKLGFPAVWWLWFGAIGLILQAVFISKKVRELNASTLPGAKREFWQVSLQKLLWPPSLLFPGSVLLPDSL